MAFKFATTVAAFLALSAYANALSVSFDEAASTSQSLYFDATLDSLPSSNIGYVGYNVTIGFSGSYQSRMKSIDWVENGFNIPNANNQDFPQGTYAISLAGPFSCSDPELTNCVQYSSFSTVSNTFNIDGSLGAIASTTTSTAANVYMVPTTTTTNAYSTPTPCESQVPTGSSFLVTNVFLNTQAANSCPEGYALAALSQSNYGNVMGQLSQSGYTDSYWIHSFESYSSDPNGRSLVAAVGNGQIIYENDSNALHRSLCQSLN